MPPATPGLPPATSARFKRYTYGDQWSDKICDGPWLRSEREQIYLSGKQPYTNNLIRQLVKTVVGRFRVLAESRGYYSRAGSAPRMPELDARLLEEFLISGMAVQRIGLDGEVENVNPRLFFINAVKDPCCRDIELIGQCHDMSLPEVYARFGHGSLERISRLTDIFRQSAARGAMPVDLGLSDDADFFTPAPGKCRVVEMWTLDAMSRLMCSEPDSGDICYRPIDELDSIHAENDRRIRNGLEPVEVVRAEDHRGMPHRYLRVLGLHDGFWVEHKADAGIGCGNLQPVQSRAGRLFVCDPVPHPVDPEMFCLLLVLDIDGHF